MNDGEAMRITAALLAFMTACQPVPTATPAPTDTAPELDTAPDTTAPPDSGPSSDTALPEDTGSPFPEPVSPTVVSTCLGGVVPGDAGTAVLCRGEDWWLPESVERSPQGTVTTYGSPLDDELKEDALSDGGNPSQAFSRRLSGTDINFLVGSLTDSRAEDALASLSNTLYNQSKRDCFDWYNDASYTFKDGVLVTPCPYSAYWCRYWLAAETSLHKDDPFVQAGVHDDISPASPVGRYERCPDHGAWTPSRRAIGLNSWGTETGNHMAEAVDAGLPSLEDAISGWLQDNGYLQTDGSLVSGSGNDIRVIYDELHETARWAETADFFSASVYPTIGAAYRRLGALLRDMDPYLHVDAVQLNGENGLIPYFVDAGMLCLDSVSTCDGRELMTMSDLIRHHRQVALDALLPSAMWMINIAQGGADFDGWVELARDEGMGLASHGPSVVFNYRFLQHLEHITYDEARRAFRAERKHGLAFLHTDIENLDHTDNTWGQYRAFRLSALSALALGFDRVLVSAYTIPSVGVLQAGERCSERYSGNQQTRCENYNHSAIAQEGAEDMLAWMVKSIGRSGTEAVEAWCAPLQLGSDGGNGLSLAERVRLLDDPMRRYGGDPSVYSPLRHYVGSGCDLSADPAYQGAPGIRMDEVWTGGEAQISSGAGMNHKLLTGSTSEGVYPYEGRTTEGTPTHSLRMTIADLPFQDASGDLVAKVVLRARAPIPQDDPTVLALRLFTTNEASTLVVSLDSSLGLAEGLHTLTGTLSGIAITEPAELTLRHLSGVVHVDVLMVRLVPVP